MAHPRRRVDARGRHVDDAVAEALRRAGAPVVRLIGVQHHDLAGQGDPGRAPIVEGLHADVGEADGIGVVAMGVVAKPGEPGLERLHAVRELPAAEPVGPPRSARSFKTREGAAP